MSINRLNHNSDKVPLRKASSVRTHVAEPFSLSEASAPIVSQSDPLYFLSDGSLGQELNKLKHYPSTIDATIDLHHCREDQALTTLQSFFSKCCTTIYKLIVIHSSTSSAGKVQHQDRKEHTIF